MHLEPSKERLPEYVFGPSERPLFPGSPFSARLSLFRRIVYAVAAIITGIASTFGNALVNVNVGTISGSLGLDIAEATVLPAIYIAFNAGANLTLVKARAQFGIPQVTLTLLAIHLVVGLLQLVSPTFSSSVLMRAVDGMAAASLVTLTIYYLVQVFPTALRPLGLVIGIGLPQIGTPLARLIPIDLLATARWHGLHLIEIAVTLGVFCVVAVVRLPPSERSQAFEWLDLLVILLIVPSLVMLCQLIGLGRTLWWTDTPGLGMLGSASILLFLAAFVIESWRSRPLVQWAWIGTWGMIQFAGVALVVRLGLAEQTYGAVGLLTSSGLTNDQLHMLFGLVILSMIVGIGVAAGMLSESRLPWQVLTASLCIAASAWLDSQANNLTRPQELFLSQMLMGFGTTLFIGPALVYGFLKMIRQGGGNFLITFVVVFSITQNVGGLMGSALLGTLQTVSARAHMHTLSERISASDPAVEQRLNAGANAYSSSFVDRQRRAEIGATLLGQATVREANVLAYDDVFRLVVVLALLTAAFITGAKLLRILYRKPTDAAAAS